ncbi:MULTISPECIES: DUF2782 domain-containing protein [Salinicola]|uniref:DUF2782 domain-containing protein n=1 Tax=Salinicola TaxID=404432 RepID=UPI0026EC3774|nr:DUF2782 domain-containing protein [Salinicola salarius]
MRSWSRMTRWPQTTLLLMALLIGGLSLPAFGQSAVQPRITSQQDDQRTIDEYRVNGKLYAIRIAPNDGKAYFLYDDNGDGDFKRVDAPSVPVPDWVQND